MSVTIAACAPLEDVESRNEAFALTHDIDDYYSRSSIFIRWIENQRLNVIRQMTAAQTGDELLEVGCGGGHVLRLFPQVTLTGVDVSSRMLDKARRNLAGYRVSLLKGQLSDLAIASHSFDRIICSEVLEHVDQPAAVLEDMRRILRPGGRAVVTFPNDHVIHAVKRILHNTGLSRLPLFGRLGWGGDQYHLHVWRVSEMRSLLQRYFLIEREQFVPSRILPIRCCFSCRAYA